MSLSTVDIIIPTFNNAQYLIPCLKSIQPMLGVGLARALIINNGSKQAMDGISGPRIEIIHAGDNLGWEGGLKLGLSKSDTPYVCFLNDDTFIPISSGFWLQQMLQHFVYPDCAAVGPASNVVMGLQNMFIDAPYEVFRVSYLIGLCMLLRRDYLDQAGGIDDTLPGGDDLDLSIRLRKLGKYLICDKQVFVYHHGFKTGERVHGTDWNSIAMQERTTKALYTKHGLGEYLNTLGHQHIVTSIGLPFTKPDSEGDHVRKWVQGSVIVELGCGDQKTVPQALGMDIVPSGEKIPGLFNRISSADIIADVFQPLPIEQVDCIIGRHVLEHTPMTIQTIKNWTNALRAGGRLIVAVPDQTKCNSIPLNPQHMIAFTPESLRHVMEAVGLKTLSIEDSENMVSMVGVFEKN